MDAQPNATKDQAKKSLMANHQNLSAKCCKDRYWKNYLKQQQAKEPPCASFDHQVCTGTLVWSALETNSAELPASVESAAMSGRM